MPLGLRLCVVVLAHLKTNPLEPFGESSVRPVREMMARVSRPRITKATERRVVELYEAGRNSHEVAEECRASKSTVLRILKNHGVEVRPQGVHY